MAASNRKSRFGRLANAVTRATGSSYAFFTAVALVLVWGATGPLFQFSAAWQLSINTTTTIVTTITTCTA